MLPEATCPHCGRSLFDDPSYVQRFSRRRGVTRTGLYCSFLDFAARDARHRKLIREAERRKLLQLQRLADDLYAFPTEEIL